MHRNAHTHTHTIHIRTHICRKLKGGNHEVSTMRRESEGKERLLFFIINNQQLSWRHNEPRT